MKRLGLCPSSLNVDFVVNGAEMKVIQHIAYERDSDTLRAHYLDTMG